MKTNYWMKLSVEAALASALVLIPYAHAQDATAANSESDIIRLSDTVTGNLEQPSVLFVVPWQSDEDKRIIKQPLKSEINSIFSLIDESEHKREIQFIESLKDKDN